jgi:hypothetical protein
MSQTDPKPQQSNPNPSAGKTPAPQSAKKAGDKKPGGKGGSSAMLYVGLVLLVVAAIVAVKFLQKGSSEERRPVVSAAEEEDMGMEAEAGMEPDADADAEAEPEAEAEASLSPALVITSDVRGAAVYLNGKRVGKTPHKATPLEPGDYDVKVMQKGYETFEQKVHVESPDDSIHANLRPMKVETSMPDDDEVAEAESEDPAAAEADIVELREAVAVKHNHRFGSCEGVLRADGNGVRYDSDHKDAFSVAYPDIEEFHLDGDKLTLKVRDGRKYDFNERNDNPDALVAFYDRVGTVVATMAVADQ